VEIRLGTLNFFDGFPDDATVEKIYDNLDFQRAVQAYLLAIPAVNQAAMRKALLQWGPANSTMPIWEDLVFPRTVGLTFNTSTPYCWMWIDLHDGPLVAEVPPGVLGAFNDHWYRWVVDVGVTGPDKGKGGKYLILPPRYDGEEPEGYFVARAQTYGTKHCDCRQGNGNRRFDNHRELRRLRLLLRPGGADGRPGASGDQTHEGTTMMTHGAPD
jgi:hypothetical protein